MKVREFRAFRAVTGQEIRQDMVLSRRKNILLAGLQLQSTDCIDNREIDSRD
jgi:hypothetical protein